MAENNNKPTETVSEDKFDEILAETEGGATDETPKCPIGLTEIYSLCRVPATQSAR